MALGADDVQAADLDDAVAEDDVDPAAGHVGGDGYGMETPGLGDDPRLLLVLLRVQHGVRDTALVEQSRQMLRLLDRHRADQDRLAPLVALGQVLHHRVELGRLRLVDQVGAVVADHVLVGRGGDDGQAVGMPVGAHQVIGRGLARRVR